MPSDIACSRNTPTGVGKTLLVIKLLTAVEKHPHGRGEDKNIFELFSDIQETPPRAWGRLFKPFKVLVLTGNTPTGVGKTLP